jgi:YD repeat-containing protein
MNASVAQVLYQGFEEMTSNVSTDSKCGRKSSSVAMNIVLPSSGVYLLTYWKKIGSESWELVEQTISSNTIIGGTGMLIDEVRLHPINARMSTYSYDEFGNLISVCDPNNIITHYEYDGFNRPKFTRDQDSNIVKHNFYNFKD